MLNKERKMSLTDLKTFNSLSINPNGTLTHYVPHKAGDTESSTEVFFIFKSKETGLDLIIFTFTKKTPKNKQKKKNKTNIATAWLFCFSFRF